MARNVRYWTTCARLSLIAQWIPKSWVKLTHPIRDIVKQHC